MAKHVRADSEEIRDTASRFKRLYTGALYDIMDEMGLPNQCLDLGIKPIDHRMQVAGPAFTVFGGPDPRTDEECEASLDERQKDLAVNLIFDEMYDGCVVVVEAAGERNCGHFGELMSSASRARGATGVVVDGGIRDGRFLYTMKDWVVFCRYISPIESRFRYRIKDLEVPISVSGSLSSQVRINPGDWIVGDVDGVLVIANAIALKLLERAEDLKDREDKTRADIVGGVSVRDIHGKYGTV